MRAILLTAAIASLVSGAISGFVVAFVVDGDDGELAARIDELAPQVADLRAAAEVDEPTVTSAAQRALPGIVAVRVELATQINGNGQRVERSAVATGLVLDEAGFIITNEHVITEALSITVRLQSGEERSAELVGHDQPFNDLAVLRIEPGGLTPATFGSSADLVQGQPVVAVGSPLGSRRVTVTAGVVSHPDTSFPRDGYIQEHLIQTDAPINEGSSGGALINLDGEIVGITTTVVRWTSDGDVIIEGVGFALQTDAVLPIARTIMEDGFFPRPTFGEVDVRSLDKFTAEQIGLSINRGAFLLEITRGGSFALAGLRPGDVVRSIDGITIDLETPYLNVLARLTPLVAVEVIYHREGEDFSVDVAPELRLQ